MGSRTIAQRGGALSLSWPPATARRRSRRLRTSNATARLNGDGGSGRCDVAINTPAATSVAPLNASAGAVLREADPQA